VRNRKLILGCRIPYIAGLVYVSIIFDRFKKGMKRERLDSDVEMPDFQGRKQSQSRSLDSGKTPV
jgi:hypothetical protein